MSGERRTIFDAFLDGAIFSLMTCATYLMVAVCAAVVERAREGAWEPEEVPGYLEPLPDDMEDLEPEVYFMNSGGDVTHVFPRKK